MLGRLFKQNSWTSLNYNSNSTSAATSNSNQNSSSTNANLISFKDCYTREILYGTSNSNQLKPYQINNKLFRILVCQDGGNLRSKQVLYDSSVEGNKSTNAFKPGNPKNIVSSKIYHNVSELNDCMFGCGLPTNESQCSTKIHILPVLNNSVYGSYHSILITRLFSITDEFMSEASTESSWKPQAALPLKLMKYSCSKNKINSRFSIGLIVPLESLDDLHDVVFNNWNEISHYLIILQKIIIKKLTLHLNEYSPYIINNRIQYVPYILQNEIDLNSQLIKLIKLIHYNSNIPKLIGSNSLIKSSIKDPRYSSMLLNWVIEILNWLEYKDGKTIQLSNFANKSQPQNISPSLNDENNSTFLSSLLALLIPIRDSLTIKPISDSDDLTKKEITRIVVMTGNPVVAKKLIFILNGIIPDNDILSSINYTNFEADHELKTNKFDSFDELSNDFSCNTPTYSSSPPIVTSVSPTNASLTKPIPIKSSTHSGSVSSSDNSLTRSIPSAKGWEIPCKSAASTTIPVKSIIETTTQIIPITQQTSMRSNSLSKSASMAYLSSSLNSSLSSSSASNYSLSKLGGSFMEKWKNSFGHSIGSNNINNIYGFDSSEYVPPPNYGSLSKRSSIQSLRTPSPAIEHDEYVWQPTPLTINNPTLTPTKISRTQSIFDLYNKNVYEECRSLDIKRTKSTVYIPLVNDSFVKNVSEHNRNLIKLKCANIMKSRISMPDHDNKILEINSINLDNNSTKTDIFVNDQSTITSSVVNSSSSSSATSSIFKHKSLLPNIAFTDEFRPEFILQSCPINPKLESQVMNAMKNDLLFYQNNCNVEKVTSRTVFISLRAREIKLIEMHVDSGQKEWHHNSSPFSLYSSENTTFDGFHSRKNSQSNSSHGYKTTIKKIYTPYKNSGDKEYINLVENILDEINHLFLIHKSNSNLDNGFNEKLSNLVFYLLK